MSLDLAAEFRGLIVAFQEAGADYAVALRSDPDGLVEWLARRIQIDPAAGPGDADAELELRIDDETRTWCFEIRDQTVTARPGRSTAPTFIVKLRLADALAILGGETAPKDALSDGRIRISGDVGLALQLATSVRFRRPAAK